MYPTDVLIYDIETATFGTKVSDTEKHELRVFGAYSYKTKEYYYLTDLKQIQKLLNSHKFIVGFHNKHYDNEVLEQHGISFHFKLIIDLYKTIDQRKSLIMWNGKPLAYSLEKQSLDFITRTLNLVTDDDAKGNIDYDVLNKPECDWTTDERNTIYNYTMRDIDITKKLWEWIYSQFVSWGLHLKTDDRLKLKHISSAPSVYTYKVLCNKVGMEEKYNEHGTKSKLRDGAYVAYPAAEKVEGNVYCLDFASLYPHIMIMCNLFGRNKDVHVGWNGNNLFTVQGYYNDKEMSKISKVIHDIYKERKHLKSIKDEKEYGLKIVMNTCYGIMRNQAFAQVYDPIIGNDCCLIGQQWIKLARNMFAEAGYFVFYTDTDSVYIQDPFNDRDRILKVKDAIISKIKNDNAKS